jgi:hypothetical protein
MGQSSSSDNALKAIKSSLGESRFGHVNQDGTAMLATSNPVEAWAEKLRLPTKLVQTLIDNVSKHVLGT